MVRREILRQGFLQEQFQILFLIVAQHETHGFDHFFLDNAKKLIQNRPTPPPPPPGGGGGGYPLRGYPIVSCPQVVVKTFLQKFFRRFPLPFGSSFAMLHPMMNKNWIPRSKRWTDAEREARKIQGQNARELRIMFYRESQEFLSKIHEEINKKLLAKRAALE